MIKYWRILKNFIKNIYFFRKELAEYHEWDYQGFLLFNKRCLEGMYEYQSTVDYMVSVNRDNHCKHMKEAIIRFDRLIEDEYTIRNCTFGKKPFTLVKVQDLPTTKMVNKYCQSIQQDDLKAIGKFYERYLLHCWH